MIAVESQPTLFWSINTFDPSKVPPWASNIYAQILPYIQEFLCADHPYRQGKVCPFVPAALKHDRIHFSLCALDNSRANHLKKVEDCIDYYLQKKKEANGFGAIIILFPDDFDIGELLQIHYASREKCISKSLMIGALYPINQASSLHNPGFYPLRTPTPVLVIRELVASDLMFLDPTHYSVSKRLLFLKAFVRSFEHQKSSVIQREVVKARILHRQYFIKLILLICLKYAVIPVALLILIYWLIVAYT